MCLAGQSTPLLQAKMVQLMPLAGAAMATWEMDTAQTGKLVARHAVVVGAGKS